MKTKRWLFKFIALCFIIIFSAYVLTMSAETKNTPTIAALKPGTWVKYHIKRNQKTDAGFKTVWESDLKISVLNEKKQKNESAYEIELVANENIDNKQIVKFFVTESGEPILDKLVIKNSNLSPLEIDLNIWSEKTGVDKSVLFKEIAGNFLIVPFTRPGTASQPDKLKISVKDKTESINCQRYIIENVQEQVSTKIWFAESSIGGQLPFPRVAKELIFEDNKSGAFQTLIMLVDYDTKDAVSLVKEKPVKLSFKEKK